MWLRIFFVLSILALETAYSETVGPGIFLATIPEEPVKVIRGSINWSVQYCPDNTCDLLEISTTLSKQDVERLTLGYFVYFSSFIYLKEWQENARSNEDMQNEIRYLINRTCPIQNPKQLVECRVRELTATGELMMFYVRFDEGTRTSTRLQLEDVLQ